MFTSFVRRGMWLGLLLVASAGCDSSGMSSVDGKVTLDGNPLPNATVQFIAQDGQGRDATGTTDAQGEFRLSTHKPGDGVMPGKYKVVIQPAASGGKPAASMEEAQKSPKPKSNPKAAASRPPSYTRADLTELTQDVPPSGPVVFNLKSN